MRLHRSYRRCQLVKLCQPFVFFCFIVAGHVVSNLHCLISLVVVMCVCFPL